MNASRQMVRCLHTLALHSDIVHRRKILAKTTLGASKHEAEGTRSVLSSYDMQDMKVIAEKRKEKAILAGNLFKRKGPQAGRRQKGGGRGNGRDNRQNRMQDRSSPRQSRGGSTSGGAEADHPANKGSKDGSTKSSSTPRNNAFPRGKGK